MSEVVSNDLLLSMLAKLENLQKEMAYLREKNGDLERKINEIRNKNISCDNNLNVIITGGGKPPKTGEDKREELENKFLKSLEAYRIIGKPTALKNCLDVLNELNYISFINGVNITTSKDNEYQEMAQRLFSKLNSKEKLDIIVQGELPPNFCQFLIRSSAVYKEVINSVKNISRAENTNINRACEEYYYSKSDKKIDDYQKFCLVFAAIEKDKNLVEEGDEEQARFKFQPRSSAGEYAVGLSKNLLVFVIDLAIAVAVAAAVGAILGAFALVPVANAACLAALTVIFTAIIRLCINKLIKNLKEKLNICANFQNARVMGYYSKYNKNNKKNALEDRKPLGKV